MKKASEVAKLLRAIAQALEDMTDDEYDHLVNGKARIRVSYSDRKGRNVKGSSQFSPDELQNLADEFLNCKSREEARELLGQDSRYEIRDTLEQIARLLQIHISKNDSRDTIEDKIIESTVGAQLRNEAIRGLDLKGSNTPRSGKE